MSKVYLRNALIIPERSTQILKKWAREAEEQLRKIWGVSKEYFNKSSNIHQDIIKIHYEFLKEFSLRYAQNSSKSHPKMLLKAPQNDPSGCPGAGLGPNQLNDLYLHRIGAQKESQNGAIWAPWAPNKCIKTHKNTFKTTTAAGS